MERTEVATGGRFIEDMFREVTFYPAGDLHKTVYSNLIGSMALRIRSKNAFTFS